MKLGSTDISKIYLGSTEVSKAYLGDVQVHGGASPVLPYDAEVEYLESTGTQYIDTGVMSWGTNITVETVMAFTDLTVERMVEGAVNRFYYGLNANRYETDYGQYWGTADTNYHTFKKTLTKASSSATKYSLQVWIDGTSRRSQSNITNPQNAVTVNVSAFALNNGGVAALGLKCKKKSHKITVNGVLVRDYIPVRVGTVGYLYDKVSGSLFGNDGADSFIVGNDVTT